ncbi:MULTISPECIES: helix-turn-helix domain-containing protein [Levilactobacillus]|uniref:helix-turn-helix domain-containing protein n=1 Tax=Levilactobacillus TaxID=2767886 RepID=UPI001951003E|nr:helix-turn-helix transcriptional regulator [Levilactobacillus sp. 244-2]
MQTVKFQDLLQAQMADSEFKIGFEQSCVKLEVAVALMQAREKAGLTQRGLAEKASVPQSTIARIERGDNTSVEMLTRLALALNKQLTISID